MPTLKPRIAVTLDQHTFDVIARMAVLQGCSRGSIVSDLLESVSPVLGRTVALLEAAANAPREIQEGLREVVETAHDDLVVISGDATKQLNLLLSALSSAGAQAEANPHVVTRGSGITDTPPKLKSKTPRKRSSTGGAANG